MPAWWGCRTFSLNLIFNIFYHFLGFFFNSALRLLVHKGIRPVENSHIFFRGTLEGTILGGSKKELPSYLVWSLNHYL